jgi:hypothetical protein
VARGAAIAKCRYRRRDSDPPPLTPTPPSVRPPRPPEHQAERLDLDYAIHVCFANAGTEQERRSRSQDGEARAQHRVTIYEAEDWDNRIRRYYDEHPRALHRVIQPIPG